MVSRPSLPFLIDSNSSKLVITMAAKTTMLVPIHSAYYLKLISKEARKFHQNLCGIDCIINNCYIPHLFDFHYLDLATILAIYALSWKANFSDNETECTIIKNKNRPNNIKKSLRFNDFENLANVWLTWYLCEKSFE